MSKKHKEKSFKDWAKAFLFTFLLLSSFTISIILFMVFLSRDLPSIEELKSFNPEQISKIISSDKQVIHKLQAVKKREVIKIDQVPDDLINALLYMEDQDFYNHSGFSFKSTFRAIVIDIFTMSYKQGASTLTQQLARSMYDKIIWKASIQHHHMFAFHYPDFPTIIQDYLPMLK